MEQQEKWIAGVDEAGRGPLAGPVYAAAVILDPRYSIKGLADSKALTEKKRDDLFLQIRKKALCWSVARATVQEIEEINILQASLLAMKRAVSRLKFRPHHILVDGNRCPIWSYSSDAIIQGDAIEPAISAASIVAKVMRDRCMKRMDKKFPDYGFAKHKGYSTAQHLATLAQFGPCQVHRKTFAPVAQFVDSAVVIDQAPLESARNVGCEGDLD